MIAAAPGGRHRIQMVGSIAIEQTLDFFWTARPEQGQHQQDPGLLRVEFIGRHQVHRIIVYFHIAPNGPGHNPAAPDNDNTLLRGIRGCLQGCLIHIAIADSSDDDALCPFGHCGVDQVRRHVGIAIQDVDTLQRGDVRDVKLTFRCVRPLRGIVETVLAIA